MLSVRDQLKLIFLPKRLYYPHLVSHHRRAGEPELGLLSELIRPGGNAVDIGCHRGVYSFQFSRFCDHVLSFEPNPDFAGFARRALPGNVTVYEFALGADASTAVLKVPMLNGVSQHYSASLLPPGNREAPVEIPVEVRTLDSFSIHDIRIIKIDVEGFELAVLGGGRTTIARERPILIVELFAGFYPDPANVMQSIARDYGYAARLVVDDRLVDAASYLASDATFESRNVVFLPLVG